MLPAPRARRLYARLRKPCAAEAFLCGRTEGKHPELTLKATRSGFAKRVALSVSSRMP
jgi:hypothetical protein